MRTGAQAAERAHHLIQALPLVDVDTAAAAAEDASRAAAAMLAYEDSARWCDRALELVEPGSATYSRLVLLAGETRLTAGDLDRAREAFLEAAEIARRTDDADLFALAALGFASGLSGFEVRLWDRVQTDLLEEGLARLGPDDSVPRAQVLARLSVALSFSASDERRRELAEEAVAMGRRLGDPGALAGALAAHCDAVAGPAYVDLREQQAGEIVALARQVPDVGLELLGLRLRVIARLERGDLAGARLDIAEFERLVARLHQPFFSWYAVLWRGLEAHLAGDLDADGRVRRRGRPARRARRQPQRDRAEHRAGRLAAHRARSRRGGNGAAQDGVRRPPGARRRRWFADPPLPRAVAGDPVGGAAPPAPDAGEPARGQGVAAEPRRRDRRVLGAGHRR